MHIKFLNLSKLYLDHRAEFDASIAKVLERAAFIGGEEVGNFEKRFASWIGPGNQVVGCANGTDAITLAAEALHLPAGSEALIPANTYVATASALVHAGLRLRLVDVNAEDWLMEAQTAEINLTAQTKLLAPVHLYGQMVKMDEFRALADRRKLFVLEDASQAHGSLWKEKPAGYWGDIATYSFYPGKNLGAFGDAGAILSRNSNYIDSCRQLSNHGGQKKYQHDIVGYNSRLDTLQAAILDVKLKYIDEWNTSRRNVAKLYRELLSDLPGLTLPRERPEARHVYHLYVVLVENRDTFISHLKKNEIETGIHYPKAIHQLPAFGNEDFSKQSFPNAERLAKHGVSLPMCPTLTLEEVEYVAKAVRSYFGK